MFKKPLLTVVAASAIAVATVGVAQARDQIRVVGSSTVFPFTTAVAEEFGNTTSFKTPIIESTGTGGGMKLFCAGVGVEHPDLTNASRRIKASEVEMCEKNGVVGITEMKVGFDGIVLANDKSAPTYKLTLRDVYLALAKDVPAPGTEGGAGNMIPNPNKTWKDVNSSLPAVEIEVLGPPPTSGTRDAFNELAIEGGCKTFAGNKAWKKADKKAYKSACRSIREDGAYVEAGENDNLIVQKLQANANALGVFGFSFLDQNSDVIKGAKIAKKAGASFYAPEFEAIAQGDYPISRSLFVYVKKAHIDAIPGIKEFITEYTSEKAWGDYGYLADKGLIPLPKKEREQYARDVRELRSLSLGS